MVELLASFVPAADAVQRLQRGQDPEQVLFQKFAERGHYGGRPGTRQGIYAAAPNGEFLASLNHNDPERVARMMREALVRYQQLTPAQRLMDPAATERSAEIRRAERLYPEDGLVLKVNSRDFPREKTTTGWRGKAWNQDFAWITRDEARAFLPERPTVGATQSLPAEVVSRLARVHLIDNVRGETIAWRPEQLQKAELVSEITAIEGGIASLRLSGAVLLSAEGVWPVNDRFDARNPERQARGYACTLLGRAKYDLERGRFVAFEMLAVGFRWGGTQYNVRHDDLEGGPLGIAFTLAGDTPAERLAPGNFGAYDWR